MDDSLGFGITYEEHFACKRPDGRYVSTMAAFMARLRDLQPELSLPEQLDKETFPRWQQAVKEKLLLQLKKYNPHGNRNRALKNFQRVLSKVFPELEKQKYPVQFLLQMLHKGVQQYL